MLSKGVQKIKLSKSFQETCTRIGECKSTEEEELIVSEWIESVKKALNKQKIKVSQLYENVVSLVHLTLLGYDTSFGVIHAVNLTQDHQMMTKALGYLSCAAILDSKSSLLILIINSTQKDLSSQHPTSMALALTAICHLVTTDLIPSIIGYVSQALQHPVPLIRQKAIMCVHSFVQKDPACVVEFFPELLRLLGDPDLSIVNAVINTFTIMLKNQLNIRQICEILPDVMNIANLILQGQAKSEYYHLKALAPFVLVNVFTLFQNMAPHMPQLSNEIADIIINTLQNGINETSSFSAILYEAIRTCIVIGLIDIPQLKGAISLFMSSENQDYKYIGLGVLSAIPDFADAFQGTIIDCLDHPDSTIRLRTLSLLHSMANENNSQIIIVNMLKFFQKTKNEAIRIELADRITSIASVYSPSPLWFAKTMEQLFSVGGDNIRPEVAFTVMNVVDENCDEEMQKGIVNLYVDIAQSGRRLSDVFVIIISHIIGLYAHLSDEYDMNFIALLLCDLADSYQNSRYWVLNALLRVASKLEEVPSQIIEVFENYKQSSSIIVQEICYEAQTLIKQTEILPYIAQNGTGDDEYDSNLTFLDDFVNDAIENKGARQYIPLEERDSDLVISSSQKQLKFTYQQPNQSVYGTNEEANYNAQYQEETVVDSNALDLTGVKMVWGETGIQDEYEAENLGNETGGQNGQEPEKPLSMFERLKISKRPAPTQEEAYKKKMGKKLFSGLKKESDLPGSSPATVPLNLPSQPGPYGFNDDNLPDQPGPYGYDEGNSSTQSGPYGYNQENVTPLIGASTSPQVYGSDNFMLTEDDYQKLEYIKSEINTPPPPQIEEFCATGEIQSVYQDNQMEVASLAQNGSVVVAIQNISQSTPMMNISIDIVGPEALIKEVITHPANLTAIPQGESVFVMASYKFPQQMKGFPNFEFNVNVSYNNGRMAHFKLPMNLGSFISPLKATTPQFGQFWKQGGSELILSLPRTDPNLTLDYASQVMNETLHVRTVERIGTEEIFCGTLVTTPFKVLVHIKFGSEKIDIKILTKAPALTQAIFNFLKNVVFM